MNVIEENNAELLREIFIDSFVDTDCDAYKNNILNVKECSDGLCYDGYYWYCLKKYKDYFYEKWN